MEKMMKVAFISPKMQKEFKRNDGTTKLVDYYEVTLTDGIDTICGETSEALTALIDTTNEAMKVHVKVGYVYQVRLNIRTNTSKKDGSERRFIAATIHQMYQMV